MATDKQVAFAVKEQRRVLVTVSGEPVEGYIMGADDYHWVVADREQIGYVHLVHKTVPCLTITNMVLAEDNEDVRNALGPLLERFRGVVMREHFGRHTQPRTA